MHDETGEERRDRLIHTFGNLTLLTHSLNSDVQDGPFKAKRPEITKQSLLLLNAYFQDTESWDEGTITTRGRHLFARARELWSRPTAG